MSLITCTWPSQYLPAPMPMVGTDTRSVISFASGVGMHSSTIENTPAFSSAFASLMRRAATSWGFALYLETTQLVDRLRRQPDVSLHRYAGCYDATHLLGYRLAAFELNRLRPAFLDETCGVAHGILGRDVVGHKGHVADYKGVLGPANNRFCVVDHFIHRHWDGGFVAQHNHAQAVAHKENGDARLIGKLRYGVIVGGDHSDLLALLLHLPDLGGGYSHAKTASFLTMRFISST